jgi:hypothetical protein
MPIKSFRARGADNTIDTISLHTNNGSTGYRIKNFEIMPIDADEDVESVVKIYTIPQTSATADIDFSDNTLLAAGIVRAGTGVSQPLTATTIFDNMTFNQDIFVTIKGNSYTKDVNYYFELEAIKLDLGENTVATLKDIRNQS